MLQKKLLDVKAVSDNKILSLKKSGSLKSPLKKLAPAIKKNQQGIREVKDIHGAEKVNFFYLKGEKFSPPKYLGNLLKIAGIGFLILLVINTINVYYAGKKLEEEIKGQAYAGFSYLIDAGKSAGKIEFESAIQTFEKAKAYFTEAESDLWFISTDSTFYSKDSYLGQAAEALLEGGEHFALAGSHFTSALEDFNKIPLYFVSKNKSEKAASFSITDVLKEGLTKTDLAISEISQANDQIFNINEEIIPAEMQTRVAYAKENIMQITELLEKTSQHFPALLKLLGDRYPHRYLILFQNNNEIRPTGGFIGSYAILDINDGFIENLEVHDSYDLDDSYGGFIEPPDELKALTGNWRFRDSNYSPDFEISARKARWFLQKEGGPSVDTVIAINQGLLKDLLEITGPVQVGEFGALDSENYNLLLSFVIESKLWSESNPKHILKVFVPAFKEALLKEENLSGAMSKLYRAIQQKHILMYSADQDIQELFESFGLSGEMYRPAANEDYLSVVNISIGGTKSEQFMEEKISHNTVLNKNGQVIDEITVTRTHQWTDDIYDQWKRILNSYGFTEMPDHVIDILGRGENKVYTRIYVPFGSRLIEADGEDVKTVTDTELNKTYFLTKMNAKFGQSDSITIKYELPFRLDFEPLATYKLIAEKQPGSRGSIFTKTLEAGEGITEVATYPQELQTDKNGNTFYATNLVYNRYFSVILE